MDEPHGQKNPMGRSLESTIRGHHGQEDDFAQSAACLRQTRRLHQRCSVFPCKAFTRQRRRCTGTKEIKDADQVTGTEEDPPRKEAATQGLVEATMPRMDWCVATDNLYVSRTFPLCLQAPFYLRVWNCLSTLLYPSLYSVPRHRILRVKVNIRLSALPLSWFI
ncbi:hypothetical protein VTK56DRAFT_4241 [Thermocarpiscus australiensis]